MGMLKEPFSVESDPSMVLKFTPPLRVGLSSSGRPTVR